MYPSPIYHLPSTTNEFVSPRKLPFQKSYESARLTINQSHKGAMRCIIGKSMDPSTKKDKTYYSTAQFYQLLNLHSSSVRGKAHTSSHRTLYPKAADQQATGGSLWQFEAIRETPTDVKRSHKGYKCHCTITSARPRNNPKSLII